MMDTAYSSVRSVKANNWRHSDVPIQVVPPGVLEETVPQRPPVDETKLPAPRWKQRVMK